MEARGEILISGVTVVVSDAVPGTENPNLASGSSAPAPAVVAQVSVEPAAGEATAAAAGGSVLSLKKKRGRPRKYGPDGTITALSPKPISSSATRPPVIDFSTGKRGKIRGVGSGMKFRQQSTLVNNRGEWVSCSVGSSFTPHMITVNAGEDVTMKVISFSQQGPRAICIISANGVISSVTLRHPDSSGGTLTYEGRFEILSLTGSFMASEDVGGGGFKNRSGGMSVSLASPDGRVVGGSVAGLLVAATPVQIVVGSFLAVDHKPNKVMKNDSNSSNEQEAYTSSTPVPVVILNQNQNQKPRNNIQTDINVSPPG